jgi:inosine-uridine nucleoside N-ribohydrolase
VAVAKTPVILSTDIGNEIDDQWAIAYLMLNPNFDVLGVISAHAPSIPDPAGYNSYLLLRDEIENRLNMRVHPPILAGADLALVDAKTPRMNDAVRFMIEQSRGYSANHRLTIIGIGAATDIASAILADPSIVDRIRVVSMAFTNENNAKEYNVQNDVVAWQVLLGSGVPLVIGPGDVCRRDLAMHYDQAKTMLAADGPLGQWLWGEYNAWYYRQVKPLRKEDFTKPWMIWDIITMAYLEGMTKEEVEPRPVLGDDLTLSHPDGQENVTWITGVDSARLWAHFQKNIKTYLSTHAVPTKPGKLE